MFESVCDCCGKRGSLNVYMLRIEKIADPSIAIRYDMGDAEVIPDEYRDKQTIKYLLCSHCYGKTGLPLFSFGEERRFHFFKPLMEFKECKFCHAKGDGTFSCELTHFEDGKCHFAMRDCENPKFGEEPTYCDDYKEQE